MSFLIWSVFKTAVIAIKTPEIQHRTLIKEHSNNRTKVLNVLPAVGEIEAFPESVGELMAETYGV